MSLFRKTLSLAHTHNDSPTKKSSPSPPTLLEKTPKLLKNYDSAENWKSFHFKSCKFMGNFSSSALSFALALSPFFSGRRMCVCVFKFPGSRVVVCVSCFFPLTGGGEFVQRNNPTFFFRRGKTYCKTRTFECNFLLEREKMREMGGAK